MLFGIGMLVSCGGRPSNVLPEDKMVKLMADMELAEAYVNTQVSASGKERVKIGKQVLAAHNVSEETLNTTLAWYGRNMDKYTELFDKVDKEIQKRQKKYTVVPGIKKVESDNLWPFNQHLVISPLAGTDNFSFSIPRPEIDKGSILEMTFSMPNPSALKGTLGVEYTDGNGEANVSNFSSKNHVQLTLQTDTAKEIARIFGIIQLKDSKGALPFYVDSIQIVTNPIDSSEYRNKKRIQKKFGAQREQKQPEPSIDTTKKDTTINRITPTTENHSNLKSSVSTPKNEVKEKPKVEGNHVKFEKMKNND